MLLIEKDTRSLVASCFILAAIVIVKLTHTIKPISTTNRILYKKAIKVEITYKIEMIVKR